MAVMSCEPGDVKRAMRNQEEHYEAWRRDTKCFNCPNNKHHAYNIMGGFIFASFCELDGEWLSPSDYRSTIADMGCEP